MTVLSLQRLVPRPRRRTAVIRTYRNWSSARARRTYRNWIPARRTDRTYRDSFFADPAAVEDDSRRMTRT